MVAQAGDVELGGEAISGGVVAQAGDGVFVLELGGEAIGGGVKAQAGNGAGSCGVAVVEKPSVVAWWLKLAMELAVVVLPSVEKPSVVAIMCLSLYRSISGHVYANSTKEHCKTYLRFCYFAHSSYLLLLNCITK